MRRILIFVLFALSASLVHAAAPTIEDFAKFEEFSAVKISPTGKYLAVAMPSGDQTGLQIIDISVPEKGFVSTAAFRFPKLEHVLNIHWVSDDRVAFETTRELDIVGDSVPRLTGMIYAINADGSGKMVVQGSRRGRTNEFGYVLDPLPDDPEHLLIYRSEYGKKPAEVVRISALDDPRDEVIATSPFATKFIGSDGFVLDSAGNVRIAWQPDPFDESLHFAYRKDNQSEWVIRNIKKEEAFSPIGFLADNKTLVIENFGRPLGYFALDLETFERKPLLTSNTVEASYPLMHKHELLGATFEDGRLENRFIDKTHRVAKLYELLGQAFEGLHVDITSLTRDGKRAVVAVSADRLPTDYYLFDTETSQANFLMASRQWLDPAYLSERQPVSFKARDGVTLHGYLTLPKGKEPKNLPLVTIVHGGPHGPRDGWLYDAEAQMLAGRGYAVLQTNFRGSGGYGADFLEMGWRNWGTRIQDDIADGVHWAVEQGIADKNRLCIYGASFGGYSVLAQLTRSPELFKCGFAFVGIYDLEMMYQVGDTQFYSEGEAVLDRYIGKDNEQLRAQSPIHFVDRIKAGLYVAHGREDQRAHVNHYLSLLKALDAANIPHKKMLKYKEGHGFYDLDNRVELYSELVDFIDAHIGENQ